MRSPRRVLRGAARSATVGAVARAAADSAGARLMAAATARIANSMEHARTATAQWLASLGVSEPDNGPITKAYGGKCPHVSSTNDGTPLTSYHGRLADTMREGAR